MSNGNIPRTSFSQTQSPDRNSNHSSPAIKPQIVNTATAVGLPHHMSLNGNGTGGGGIQAALSLPITPDERNGDSRSLLGVETMELEEEDALLLRDAENGKRGQREDPKKEVKNIHFLCLDLTHVSSGKLFFLLSAGILGFFLLNSWLEEYLFKQLKSFKFGWYMTAFELLCFAAFAALERQFRSSGPNDSIWQHNAQYKHHLFVAVCMTCSRGLTNKSLEYLNYPTQVIFKSMKLITVMIGSLFILQQKFTFLEYVNAVALVISAILFSLGDNDTAPEVAGWTGIIIVCLSLVADALHGNTQEQLLKEHKASNLEALLFTNLFAAIMSLAWVIVTGEFMPAFAYCAELPIAYVLFVVRASVIYLGVLCFLLMINTFGVVQATAITTVRKILTIIASFLIFPKAISSRHILGGLIFAGGIVLSVWDTKLKALRKEREAKANLNLSMMTRNNSGNLNNGSTANGSVSIPMVNMNGAGSSNGIPNGGSASQQRSGSFSN